MASSRAREIAKEAARPVGAVSGEQYERIAAGCERAIQHFAREMAEKIRAEKTPPRGSYSSTRNATLDATARLILDAAGITEGRDEK